MARGRTRNSRRRPSAALTGGSVPQLVPVVGIGASAGGLEALELMLAALPLDSGLAFVVVQHLDPTRSSALPELLQRTTRLKVTELRARAVVRPDHIYVAPPGKQVSLSAGRFRVRTPVEARGRRLPIDDLFLSLAGELGHDATGVVLSGMGDDGTRGLQAIRDAGGRTFAQQPATAAFDQMPCAAIDAGVVDALAAPADLPALLTRTAGPVASTDVDAQTLRSVLERLRAAIGTDFGGYKPATVRRRIGLRMAHHKLDSIQAYLDLVERDPAELVALGSALLIGVTSFFRDPPAWERLEQKALPPLLAALGAGAELRAWVPACSTGEEAYSLAIALLESLERIDARQRPSVRIFATDVNAAAIEVARRGEFSARIASELPAARLKRYFTVDASRYRIRKSVRDLIVFATHDVLEDPPFTRVDLLACRNLLIYLTPELQRRVIGLFEHSLRPGGVLFLGAAETPGTRPRRFEVIDASCRLYRRGSVPSAPRVASVRDLGQRSAAPSRRGPGAPAVLGASGSGEQALLRMLAPAGVVIDEAGEVVHWLGSTSAYLRAASGTARPALLSLVKPRWRAVLGKLIASMHQVWSGDVTRQVTALQVPRSSTRITATRLHAPAALRGLLLLTFEDLPNAPRRPTRAAGARAMRHALGAAQQEVVALRRELLRTRSQLGAVNQELQSMNEELQSANEELTTSKEETQSMNEELQTVNAELQSKLASLSLVNDDLRNLLESTDIAIVFLDPDLAVRRFTRPVTAIARLIPSDVGRPFGDIRTDLDYREFDADIRRVLQQLTPSEKVVSATDGRWFRVRIMAYQTHEGVMDGVVITFTEVTEAKCLEHELRNMREMADARQEKS